MCVLSELVVSGHKHETWNLGLPGAVIYALICVCGMKNNDMENYKRLIDEDTKYTQNVCGSFIKVFGILYWSFNPMLLLTKLL